MKQIIFSVLFVATISNLNANWAVADITTIVPTPPPSSAYPVTVSFTGHGSAGFLETYSQQRSSGCSPDTITSKEDVSSIYWNVEWKKVKPAAGKFGPKKSSFSGNASRTDSSSCSGPQPFSVCASNLNNAEGSVPLMEIKKSGKNYILTLKAEDQLRGSNASGSTCIQTSVFDNAITEGMNNTAITQVRIKLTPAKTSSKKKLKFNINKNFDCNDPAKVMFYLSSSCSVTTVLSGTVTVNGKYTAKLMK